MTRPRAGDFEVAARALLDISGLAVEPNIDVTILGIDAGFGAAVSGITKYLSHNRNRLLANLVNDRDISSAKFSCYDHILICD